MKKFIGFCLSLALVLFLTATTHAQAQTSADIAVAQVYECRGTWDSSIVIAYGSKTEKILMSDIGNKSYEANAAKIQEVVARLYKEGYVLQQSNSVGHSSNDGLPYTHTYYFPQAIASARWHGSGCLLESKRKPADANPLRWSSGRRSGFAACYSTTFSQLPIPSSHSNGNGTSQTLAGFLRLRPFIPRTILHEKAPIPR